MINKSDNPLAKVMNKEKMQTTNTKNKTRCITVAL